MSLRVLIGLDDTDIKSSPGTGRIAREMADYLVDMGLGRSLGVTRHQLLVDPRIPYTSHNSSLCIGLETTAAITELHQPCVDYLMARFQEGADPGICICETGQVGSPLLDFAHSAASLVLTKKDATHVAAAAGIFLRELGGTGGGVIGAMAAVGLRANGNGGRYIGLRGIRDVSGDISVTKLKEMTDIVCVADEDGKPVDDAEIVESQDWIRPSLVGGQPILRVRRRPASGKWECIERKKSHEGKQREE